MVSKGFSLIELMIVVAIVGILASIAIPAYQSYIARAQASEAVSLLSSLKMQISEYFVNNGSVPAYSDLNSRGAASDGGSFTAVLGDGPSGAGSGQYQAKFKSTDVSPLLSDRTVVLTFVTSTKSFVWSCSNLIATIKPNICR